MRVQLATRQSRRRGRIVHPVVILVTLAVITAMFASPVATRFWGSGAGAYPAQRATGLTVPRGGNDYSTPWISSRSRGSFERPDTNAAAQMSVLDTIDLTNQTTTPGYYSPINMLTPVAAAAPPGAGQVLIVSSALGVGPAGTDVSGIEAFDASSSRLIGAYATGQQPEGIALDEKADEAFVPNLGSNNVSMFNYSSDRLSGWFGSWFAPDAVAFDSHTDQVFTANSASGNVSVTDIPNGTVPASISVGTDPDAIAYDPAGGEVFVATYNSSEGQLYGNVSIINDTHDDVTSVIPVGMDPAAILFSPTTQDVYVASVGVGADSNGYSNVTIINGTSNLVEGNLTAGFDASGLADELTPSPWLFVANEGSANVTVFNLTTDQSVESIPLPVTPYGDAPTAITYDSTEESLYVVDSNANNVTVIHVPSLGVSGTWQTGASPTGLIYDSQDDVIQVEDSSPQNIAQIGGASGTEVGTLTEPFLAPGALAYDPVQDDTFLTNYWSFNAGFTAWSELVAAINDTSGRVASTAPVGVYAGNAVYDSGLGEIFIANFGSDNLTVVNATHDKVVANVPVGQEPDGLAYDPSDGEVFVANFLSNNISVVADSSNRVIRTITGMDGPEGLTFDSSGGDLVVANAFAFNVTVLNASTGAFVTSIPVVGPSSAVLFDPLDDEVYATSQATSSVLSLSALNWSVTGSVVTGDQPIALALDTASGDIYVDNWLSGDVSVLSPGGIASLPVRISETGLPSGTAWGVTFDERFIQTQGTEIQVDVPPGNYSYNVSAVVDGLGREFQAGSPNGILDVSVSSANSILLIFSVEGYAIRFTELGLPAGATWSVNLSGQLLGPSSGVLVGYESTGAYSYNVSPESGYLSNPSSGWVEVESSEQNLSVTFSPTPRPPTEYAIEFREAGLTSNTVWWVNVSGGSSNSTSESLLSILEVTGSYAYEASAYGYTNAAGTFVVNDSGTFPLVVQVNFSKLPAPPSPSSGGLPGTDLLALAGGAGIAAGVLAAIGYRRIRRKST